MKLTKEADRRIGAEQTKLESLFKVGPNEESYRASRLPDAGYKPDIAYERWVTENNQLYKQKLQVLAQEKIAKRMRLRL